MRAPAGARPHRRTWAATLPVSSAGGRGVKRSALRLMGDHAETLFGPRGYVVLIFDPGLFVLFLRERKSTNLHAGRRRHFGRGLQNPVIVLQQAKLFGPLAIRPGREAGVPAAKAVMAPRTCRDGRHAAGDQAQGDLYPPAHRSRKRRRPSLLSRDSGPAHRLTPSSTAPGQRAGRIDGLVESDALDAGGNSAADWCAIVLSCCTPGNRHVGKRLNRRALFKPIVVGDDEQV